MSNQSLTVLPVEALHVCLSHHVWPLKSRCCGRGTPWNSGPWRANLGGNASNCVSNVMSDLKCVLAIGLHVWGRYTQLPYHLLITSHYLPSQDAWSIVHKDVITFTNASIASSLWVHAFHSYSCPLSVFILTLHAHSTTTHTVTLSLSLSVCAHTHTGGW